MTGDPAPWPPAPRAAPASPFAGTELPGLDPPTVHPAGQSRAAAAATATQPDPGPATAPRQMPRFEVATLQKSRSEEIPRQRGRAEPFKEAATRFRLESAHGGWQGSSYLQVMRLLQHIHVRWCERCF